MDHPLPQWLAAVADELLIEHRRTSLLSHNLSKGMVREDVLSSRFLDKYLPGHVKLVRGGEVRSVQAEVSSQQDILVVDPRTPPLYAHDYQVVPIECVHMVGEVKSNLTVRELEQTWHKTAAVKRMQKVAYRQPRNHVIIEPGGMTAYGKRWSWYPTSGFIFAYDSADLLTLADRVLGLSTDTEPEHRIDAIFVLNKGVVHWGADETHYLTRPDTASKLGTIATAPNAVLILMVWWLSEMLGDVWSRPFDIARYLGGVIDVPSVMGWHEPD